MLAMKPEYRWHRDKRLLREVISELRGFWNKFDPIGVVDDWQVDDEYDSYLGGTLAALQKEDNAGALFSHILKVLDHMGLTTDNVPEREIGDFIGELVDWFDTVEARAIEAGL